MYFCSRLLPLAFLSAPVLAFYPYDPSKAIESHGDNQARSVDYAKRSPFYVWTPSEDKSGDGGQRPPTLRFARDAPKTVEKRVNSYKTSPGSQPSAPNSMAIDEDGSDISYFSTVKFGSKGKALKMLLDTGAANTWVMSSDCASKACDKHDTFGSGDSTTYKKTDTSWNVSYGTGMVSGQVVNDTLAFAGFTIPMSFGSASQTSDDFLTYTMDGILGLGRPSKNELDLSTVMGQLSGQGSIKSNVFGLNLQRQSDGATDGAITFGDWDKSKFSGDLSYVNTVSSTGLWEIPVDDAGVDGKGAKLSGKTAIIDSGTSFILMPPDDAKKIHDMIPKSQSNGEAFTVPCSSTANVQITFSGQTYDIPPKDYVGGKTDGGMCSSNIAGHQPFGANQWLLGDTFLKVVYTVFDLEKNRIGFGKKSASKEASKGSTPSPSGSSSTTSSSSSGSSSPSPSKADGATSSGSSSPSSTTSTPPPLGIPSAKGSTQSKSGTSSSSKTSGTSSASPAAQTSKTPSSASYNGRADLRIFATCLMVAAAMFA